MMQKVAKAKKDSDNNANWGKSIGVGASAQCEGKRGRGYWVGGVCVCLLATKHVFTQRFSLNAFGSDRCNISLHPTLSPIFFAS